MLFQRPVLAAHERAQQRGARALDARRALAAGEGTGAARTGARGPGASAFRSARALSGGQQQRLALARAWSLKPDLLFLDEPTSNLDPRGKREVESLMAEFGEGGMTLVFASHNLGQVKRLATRVLYLEQGKLLADLPVHSFFDRDVLRGTSHDADLFVKGELA